MIQDDIWFKTGDGTALYVRRWLPDPEASGKPSAALKPSAVVHIVHGMGEHGGRYAQLAEKLCAAGIAVWAADQRGHGKTATAPGNEPGKGGMVGHCTDNDTFNQISADIDSINNQIRQTYAGIPLFLLGHSWGSFITQYYIEGGNGGTTAIDGCILSGTRGPDGLKVKAGLPVMSLLAFIWGRRTKVSFARAVADGPYNRPFRPNRTPFDWLSRDEAKTDAFAHDPLCGNLCSAGFYRDLAKGLNLIHRPEAMARIRRDLPVYIVCGSADPVGEMGAGPTALVNAYRSLGIKDLEFALYPGARHEPFNETNREEVMDNLLSWICRHIDTMKTERG